MIVIIHGDDIVSSRSYLLEQKEKDKNAVALHGNLLTISFLAQNLEGSSLFSETKVIIIEDFFARAKKMGNIKEIIDFLNKHQKFADIFFWEGRELSKRELSLFPSALPRLFKLPKALFAFLDNLLPDNAKKSIQLFHKTLETSAIELIFFMLQRQFRLLLALSDRGLVNNIDEAIRLAPWQRQKLERQASRFSQAKLKELYQKIFEIEVRQRTGNLPLSLAKTIDFFLLEI